LRCQRGILRDLDIYKPDSTKFDPVRAVEYAASPLLFIVKRDTSATGQAFVSAIRNATLSRDLNAYRGFVPANDIYGAGLASPSFGRTIKVSKRSDGGFQGVYVGAGPYLSMVSSTHFDQQLTNLLASSTAVVIPNAQMPITNTDQTQFALAVTGGYRAHMPWANGVGSGSNRDGLYLAANYNYLRGFRYEDVNLLIRFDTDRNGLVTFVPTLPPPVAVGRLYSTSGQGFGIDVGVGAVIDEWEFGFSANGIANRIDWDDVTRTTYTLQNLLTGGDFQESVNVPLGTTRIELPVDYRGNVAFRNDEWGAAAEVGHGLSGTTVHAGLERRFTTIELRGGARYNLETWNPTGGVGFNLSPRVAIDVAAFGTSANIERKRKLGIATSLRINAKRR